MWRDAVSDAKKRGVRSESETYASAKYVQGLIGSGSTRKGMRQATNQTFWIAQMAQRLFVSSDAMARRRSVTMEMTDRHGHQQSPKKGVRNDVRVFGTARTFAMTVEKPSDFIEIWK